LVVRQRYRYDSGNQRTIKQTLDQSVGEANPERIALYVYPGDFERRGLVRSALGDEYQASVGLDTETQYLVGGARVVWMHGGGITGLDREQRITVPLTDLIQTTAAVLDLNSGALLEYSSYYPNGARESYRHAEEEMIAAEPMGFTGKESDEEVGLTYFGERYLISRIGRWASPDPLQVHAAGGGEAINGYHYVAGNLLQARDPLGLVPDTNLDRSEQPAPQAPQPEWHWRELDQAPDLAPPTYANHRWAISYTDDGREVYYVWIPPRRVWPVPNGPSVTVPGEWAQFQLSGSATGSDDLDTIQDIATLGGAILVRAGGRLFLRVMTRRIAREVGEEAAERTLRVAGEEAGEALAREVVEESGESAARAGASSAARGGILRSAGNGSWISRGGLRYGADPNFGNRVRHVLNHAADIPGRTGAHGVFDAGRRGALGVVDDAWAIAQRGGSGVSVSTQGARTVYTVDMGRRVGFVGGQAGAAAGNPAASHVRLVLQGNDVITAFPVIP
ncbi:MAG: hypothetical protein K8H88_09275, partial [Sandaracinaceae bacterium]|nr:hypothetical protein [Sandaracinaceae bacterium]